MKILPVTSLRQFDELADLWRELAETGGQASPLTSHEWFACCWRTAGPSRIRELWIVEDTAGPVALVPLVRRKLRFGGLPARVVKLMHAPEVPLVDFPVARDVDEVMSVVVDELCTRDDWDLLVLPWLPSDSPTWKAFQAAAEARLPWRIAARARHACIPISERDHSLRRALAQLRAGVTAAGAAPGVTIEEHRDLDPGGPVFDDLMDMVEVRPTKTPGLPPASREDIRRFFRELSVRASKNGWLSLWVLRRDGRIVESEYQIAANGHVHALRRQTDRRAGSPALGDHLTLAIMEALLERPGVHTYHRHPLTKLEASLPVPATRETLVVEAFAPRTYASLLRHVETRVFPLARRLAGRRERPCE